MVMPLWDENPFHRPRLPWVTWSLIGVNIVVFVVGVSSGAGDQQVAFNVFGVVPAAVSHHQSLVPPFPPALTLVTYQFVHLNLLHLFGNMVFLFVFGDDVEEATGPWRFLFFYLVCGIAGGLAYVASSPQSLAPLGGASGAVAGVIGAYLLLRPCARITVLLFYFVTKINAYWVIVGWALLQLWQIETKADDGVAYWAHMGGLAAGAAMFPVLRRPGVELFECVSARTGSASTPDTPV